MKISDKIANEMLILAA